MCHHLPPPREAKRIAEKERKAAAVRKHNADKLEAQRQARCCFAASRSFGLVELLGLGRSGLVCSGGSERPVRFGRRRASESVRRSRHRGGGGGGGGGGEGGGAERTRTAATTERRTEDSLELARLSTAAVKAAAKTDASLTTETTRDRHLAISRVRLLVRSFVLGRQVLEEEAVAKHARATRAR